MGTDLEEKSFAKLIATTRAPESKKLRTMLTVRSQRVTNAPEGTRTPNLLIRSQMLYPIELRAHALAKLQTTARPLRTPDFLLWAVQDSNL